MPSDPDRAQCGRAAHWRRMHRSTARWCKQALTSMRLNRRTLWKVLLRSSPMTSGSYLSILVRNTRVGISAQHLLQSISDPSINAVIKSSCICMNQHNTQSSLERKICNAGSCVSCLWISNGSSTATANPMPMAAQMSLACCVPVKSSDLEQARSFLLTSLSCKLPHLPQSLHV